MVFAIPICLCSCRSIFRDLPTRQNACSAGLSLASVATTYFSPIVPRHILYLVLPVQWVWSCFLLRLLAYSSYLSSSFCFSFLFCPCRLVSQKRRGSPSILSLRSRGGFACTKHCYCRQYDNLLFHLFPVCFIFPSR